MHEVACRRDYLLPLPGLSSPLSFHNYGVLIIFKIQTLSFQVCWKKNYDRDYRDSSNILRFSMKRLLGLCCRGGFSEPWSYGCSLVTIVGCCQTLFAILSWKASLSPELIIQERPIFRSKDWRSSVLKFNILIPMTNEGQKVEQWSALEFYMFFLYSQIERNHLNENHMANWFRFQHGDFGLRCLKNQLCLVKKLHSNSNFCVFQFLRIRMIFINCIRRIPFDTTSGEL